MDDKAIFERVVKAAIRTIESNENSYEFIERFKDVLVIRDVDTDSYGFMDIAYEYGEFPDLEENCMTPIEFEQLLMDYAAENGNDLPFENTKLKYHSCHMAIIAGDKAFVRCAFERPFATE